MYWSDRIHLVVEVEEEHKERTAFIVGLLGFFEYNIMPFGLSNSPATYQRIMEECLWDYNMKFCIIYLDDLIILVMELNNIWNAKVLY